MSPCPKCARQPVICFYAEFGCYRCHLTFIVTDYTLCEIEAAWLNFVQEYKEEASEGSPTDR